MLPLFSARTRRISKISSCFRMPVAPAISRSLAILVSAEMLISFIADSEITWAGGVGADCGCGDAAGAGAVCAGTACTGEACAGAVATPPFALVGLRSSSTVHPILRRSALKPAERVVDRAIQAHGDDACVRRAS